MQSRNLFGDKKILCTDVLYYNTIRFSYRLHPEICSTSNPDYPKKDYYLNLYCSFIGIFLAFSDISQRFNGSDSEKTGPVKCLLLVYPRLSFGGSRCQAPYFAEHIFLFSILPPSKHTNHRSTRSEQWSDSSVSISCLPNGQSILTSQKELV